MIPKIIHQTARTKDISWEENVLVRRMQNKLKGWTYMFHDDDDNDRLVKTYFPEYYNVFSSISKGVAKADIARLIYLYVYGGFYFDTDYNQDMTIDGAYEYLKQQEMFQGATDC